MGRQNWRTPPSVFKSIESTLGISFHTDAASSAENHLCDRYCTDRGNGIEAGLWIGDVWINPPFGDIMPWVKVAIEYKKNGIGLSPPSVVLIGPANVSSPWFQFAIDNASLFLPSRRIQFWHPKEKPGSPDRDTVIFCFSPRTKTNVVRVIEIPEHANEVRRLWMESQGQKSLFHDRSQLFGGISD